MVTRINLALQGGGAHGAYTWGVLDRLLEEPEIEIAGISGTSAGALNGAALKAGLLIGGRQGARDNLDWLWAQMGALGNLWLTQWISHVAPSSSAISAMLENSWHYMIGEAASQMTSPYAMGPFYRNPLQAVVEQFHYDQVCADRGPRLFIGATNVRSGKIKVFEGAQISTKALLASACLPTLFQAVEIADPDSGTREAYWDGGYSGNPALFPLFDEALPADIVIVGINPLCREDIPRSPQAIQNRINEISFNSSLLRELRAIAFVQRLLAEGALKPGSMKKILAHMISDDALMTQLSVATKMAPGPVLLARLKQAGRNSCDAFLASHRGDLNQRSTVDLQALYG